MLPQINKLFKLSLSLDCIHSFKMTRKQRPTHGDIPGPPAAAPTNLLKIKDEYFVSFPQQGCKQLPMQTKFGSHKPFLRDLSSLWDHARNQHAAYLFEVKQVVSRRNTSAFNFQGLCRETLSIIWAITKGRLGDSNQLILLNTTKQPIQQGEGWQES